MSDVEGSNSFGLDIAPLPGPSAGAKVISRSRSNNWGLDGNGLRAVGKDWRVGSKLCTPYW